MIRDHRKDRILLFAVLALLVLGCIMIYSASAFWSAEKNNDDYSLILKRHLIRLAVGLFVMFVVSRIDYHRYRKWTPYLLLVMGVLLAAVLLTPKFRGSSRAFMLPGGRLHPAEYMKLTLVLYLSSVLARGMETEKLGSKKLIVHYVILLGITALVLFEPDLGTAMVLFFSGLFMFLLAGAPGDKLLKLLLSVTPFVLFEMAVNSYQRDRIVEFVKTKLSLMPFPYQIQHSLIALANGGLFGSGYGEGNAKNLYLPEPFSDFILATLGEEFGFIGIFMLFGILAVVLWRGTRIALHAPDRYGFLIAGGVTSLLMINALINAGVTTHLLPTTGLPFPFISYGGSSLFVYMAGMGILLNISGKTVASFRQFTTERGRIRWPATGREGFC
jgi:cell division protein FtsW